MRRAIALVVIAAALALGSTAGAASWSYVASGAPADWQLGRAPRPTVALGVRALATLEALRSASVVAPPAPPSASAWTRGAMPFVTQPSKQAPRATVIALDRSERAMWLRARLTFSVGPELARLRVLRLRVRYQDGLIISINGQELARRHVGDGATALRVHGPEWEEIYLPATPGLLRAGPNQLELEVRPHRTHVAPALDLTLEGAEEVRLTRGPIVQRIGPTSATIVFETDLATTASVDVTAGGQRRSVLAPLGVRHVVQLDGLPAGGMVDYQVRWPGGASAAERFHTAPDPREPLRIAVYGDVRSGHDVHGQLVAAMLAWAPDLVLTTGDMVLRGSDEGDWQRYFAVTGELLAEVPVYPAIGNHDLAGEGTRQLEDIFALPAAPPGRPTGAFWWSTDVSGVHLVALDSNRYDDAGQAVWLEADSAAARGRGVRAIIVITHDGPFSRGLHGGSKVAREQLVPIMARYRVALLVSGHDHLYQRGREGGLDYVVSGGGGAPLYKLRCGVTGKPRCKVADGMLVAASEHHWLELEIRERDMALCPRRLDGTLIEKCVTLPLAP